VCMAVRCKMPRLIIEIAFPPPPVPSRVTHACGSVLPPTQRKAGRWCVLHMPCRRARAAQGGGVVEGAVGSGWRCGTPAAQRHGGKGGCWVGWGRRWRAAFLWESVRCACMVGEVCCRKVRGRRARQRCAQVVGASAQWRPRVRWWRESGVQARAEVAAREGGAQQAGAGGIKVVRS